MKRLWSLLWWLAPPAVTLAAYWDTLDLWFRADDFAWLGLARSFNSWRDLPGLLFTPMAQGTIRPLSERAYFLALYQIFGPDPLPFRIVALATQMAAASLLAVIVSRITGSRLGGLLAALLWVFSAGPANPLIWISAYNQILLALSLLVSFWLWVRYWETGERRHLAAVWASFLIGFGVQEGNVVFPGLALIHAMLYCRRRWKAAAWLMAASAAYVILHFSIAPKPAKGEYALFFDRDVAATLATYWGWAVGFARYPEYFAWPGPGVAAGGVALLSAALLGLVLWSAWRREFAPLFFLSWFFVTLAPVLPLKLHRSDYYLLSPAAGLAACLAASTVFAWKRRRLAGIAVLALSSLQAAIHVPIIRSQIEWFARRSEEIQKVVLGAEAASRRHSGKLILLTGVSDLLFYEAVYDRAFQVFGAPVLLAPHGGPPGIETAIPDWTEFVMPEAAARAAIRSQRAVVYDASRPKLLNVNRFFRTEVSAHWSEDPPRRVEPARPGFEGFLGDGWLESVGDLRWTARGATAYIRGPERANQQLWLWIYCRPEHTRDGALPVKVSINGNLLKELAITSAGRLLTLTLPLPAGVIGDRRIEVRLESGREVVLPGTDTSVGVAVRALEVR